MSPFIKLAWGRQFENTVQTKLFGKYNFENIMAAICLGVSFNVSAEMINEAISEYTPKNNRSQVEFRNDNILILDAYNANPTSLSAALENFSELNNDNKVVIIGDMFELGKNKDEEHLKIIELLKSKNFVNVYLVGKIFKSVNFEKKYTCFETSDEGREFFISNKIINSLVLVKGSRGIQLEKIAEIL